MTLAMGLLLRLGSRNLLRHRRRNALLLAAIAVGIASTVLSNALIRGYQYDMRDDAIDNLNGHLKVVAPGYLDDPSAARAFALTLTPESLLPSGAVTASATRIRVPAVVQSERETRGVELVGIDPADEEFLSFLGSVDIDGKGLAGASDGRLLLGRELAARLDTQLGRRVVVMALGADGRHRELGFRIVGVFDTPGRNQELAYAVTGRDALARQLGVAGVTEISFRLANENALDESRRLLVAALPALQVHDWKSLDPLAAGMFELADAQLLIWLLIVLIALGFGLVNALATAVLERTREFGLLRALGMHPRHVLQQVLVESLLVTLAGVLVGTLAGCLFVLLLADGIDVGAWATGAELFGMRQVLVPRLLFGDLVLVLLASFIFAFLGSLYPAWRAIATPPLVALQGSRT